MSGIGSSFLVRCLHGRTGKGIRVVAGFIPFDGVLLHSGFLARN